MKASAANLEKHVRALTDDIGIRLAGSPEEYKAAEYIKNETLSLDIVKKDGLTEKCDLNGHNCYIDVER